MLDQISTTLLDTFILSILIKKDIYGYLIAQRTHDVIGISESSLYKALRRLLNDGYVTTYDKPCLGRNRRYYALTDSGKEQYYLYLSKWESIKRQIDNYLVTD